MNKISTHEELQPNQIKPNQIKLNQTKPIQITPIFPLKKISEQPTIQLDKCNSHFPLRFTNLLI